MSDMKSIAFVILTVIPITALAVDPKTTIVVKVNGVGISKADLLFAATQQGIAEDQLPEQEARLIDQLIERQLIRGFLTGKKIEAVPEELQFQIGTAYALIRKRGEDPQKLLTKLGYTPDRLKRELGLTLAWKIYVNQTINDQQIKDYFQQHKQELDGTQLRARQIFLRLPKSPSDDEIATKKSQLSQLRQEILDNKTTFEDAAKKHSEAESREQGGDVGLFSWRAGLAQDLSHPAFSLKIGEISKPVVTAFGVHLVQVTERHAGDFSVEDVRSEIVDQLSEELWRATVAKERKSAKIERPRKP